MNKPKKKIYERWWVWILGVLVLMIMWNSVSEFVSGLGIKEIPNVMGLSYEDAETVLKGKGFRVIAIEANAESILSNSAWNRSVKEGEVFQINNETAPHFYSNKTKDKKVTIYYAENDYIYVEPAPESEPVQEPDTSKSEPSDSTSDQSDSSSAVEPEAPEQGISPEFKEMMDSYEAFFDEYIAFMKKYKESNNNLALMSEFGDYMTKYADMMEKLEAIDDPQLSTAESMYYAEVSARISQKLLASTN